MVDTKEVGNIEYWMGRCYELWKLLDDIDTAGDMAKFDDKLYRAMAERHQAKRWEFLEENEVDLLYKMFYDPAFDIPEDEEDPCVFADDCVGDPNTHPKDW